MPFFTARFKNEHNVMVCRYEFHPPHLIMLLHYLVKVATPMMHMIANSPFNVNYSK